MIKIGVEPNGLNINFEVGSTAPEALARKVREMRADVGIALDGDADRMILIDEKGQLIDGDQVMAVIAESWRDEADCPSRAWWPPSCRTSGSSAISRAWG